MLAVSLPPLTVLDGMVVLGTPLSELSPLSVSDAVPEESVAEIVPELSLLSVSDALPDIVAEVSLLSDSEAVIVPELPILSVSDAVPELSVSDAALELSVPDTVPELSVLLGSLPEEDKVSLTVTAQS